MTVKINNRGEKAIVEAYILVHYPGSRYFDPFRVTKTQSQIILNQSRFLLLVKKKERYGTEAYCEIISHNGTVVPFNWKWDKKCDSLFALAWRAWEHRNVED